MKDKMLATGIKLERRAAEVRRSDRSYAEHVADAYEEGALAIRDAVDGPLESIRCSRLPLALLCPASTLGDWSVEGDDYAARLGTAVHKVLADHLSRRGWDTEAAATQFSVDAAEVESLVFMAVRLWDNLGHLFPNPEVEKGMAIGTPELMLTGTADVVSYDPDAREVRVLDWKSGRDDADHEEQLKGYCWLALAIYEEADVARGCVVRIRDRVADWTVYTREALAAWWATVVQRLAKQTVYRPGNHCSRCPQAYGCHAKAGALQQAAVALIDHPNADIPVRPQQLGDLYDRIKTLEVLCDQAKTALKAEVASRGGRLDLGNGRTLEISESVTRSVDYLSAVTTLEDELTEEEVARCLSIRKTALDKAIMETAPRGQKTARLKEVYARLEEAGAIQTTTTQRLEMKRNGDRNGNATEDERDGSDQPALIPHREGKGSPVGADS